MSRAIRIKNKTIINFLKKHTKMYDLYKEVEDVFIEPELYMFHGSWREDPCLPVWRRGPVLYLNKTGTKKIQFPIWMRFDKFDFEVGWKTKYDEYRYEWPPQFTLVFFGRSVSFWLRGPKTSNSSLWNDDAYWESILYFTDDQYGKHDIAATAKIMNYSYWTTYSDEEKMRRDEIYDEYKRKGKDADRNEMFKKLEEVPGTPNASMQLDREFLKPKYRPELKEAYRVIKIRAAKNIKSKIVWNNA